MSVINYADEVIKCALDIQYFVQRYVDISCICPPSKRLHPNKYFFLHQTNDYKNIITVHERSTGCSLTLSIILLHKLVFNHNIHMAVMSHDMYQGMNLLENVHLLHDALPPFLQLLHAFRTPRLLRLANGSKINVISADNHAFRGMILDFICIDNAALIPNLTTIYNNLQHLSTISNCRCLIASASVPGSTFDSLVFHSALHRTRYKLIYFPSH